MPNLIIKLPLPERFGGSRRETVGTPTKPASRPIRSTRTPVSTYNLPPKLTGTAVHTRTKYLGKHLKDVQHGPSATKGFASSRNAPSAATGKVASLPSRLGARTVQFQRSEEDEIRGWNSLFLQKTREALAVADAPPYTMAIDAFRTLAMAHPEELVTLPEVKKRLERMKKRLDDYEAKNDLSEDIKKELEMMKRTSEAIDDDAAKINHWRAKKIKMETSSADLTHTLLSYLKHFGQPDFRETISLAGIEESLIQITPFLSAILEGQDCAPIFSTALAAWLNYRRILLLTHISHTTPLLPSQILSPFTIKIKNSRLLTELRKARNDFVSTETGELGVDEVLVDGFIALQRTVGYRREVGNLVEAGLKRLNDRLVELGDEMGKGAGWWVLTGLSSGGLGMVGVSGEGD